MSACSFLRNNFISLALCFSILSSSFNNFSFNFNLRSSSNFFNSSNFIFSFWSFSICSNLIFLFSSTLFKLNILIFSSIFWKNLEINLSIANKSKLILNLSFDLIFSSSLTDFEIKLSDSLNFSCFFNFLFVFFGIFFL